MQPISRKQAIKQGLTRYYTGKACKNGHLSPRWTSSSVCQACYYGYRKKWRADNSEKTKAQHARHNDNRRARAQISKFFFTGKPCSNGHINKRFTSTGTCLLCNRLAVAKWRADNPEKHRAQTHRDYHNNKAKHNARSREYGRRNRKRLTEYNREYMKTRWKKYWTLKRKIANLLRVRLRGAVKRQQKSGSAIRDLGCSIEQFKLYIAAKFSPSMSWDNHGKVWEIDHIKPLSSFDLTDRAQLLLACHYSNYQPLVKSDHQTKTAKDFQRFVAQRKEN